MRLLVTGLLVGTAIGLSLAFVGIGEALKLVPAPSARDWFAYWDAAQRVRDGQALYPPVAHLSAETTYRYAPWFAFAWVPLTYLPRDVAGVLWVTAMYVATVAAVLPLLRSRSLPAVLLAALLVPYLLLASAQGNVQPAIIASLVYGVDRRWGPLAIGLAASLKLFPILYAGQYALRRQWGRCAVALAVTAVLVVPMLAVDLSHYPVNADPTASLWLLGPVPWLIGALVAIAVAVRLRAGPARWFAASVAVVMATPRLVPYDFCYLLVTGRDVVAQKRERRAHTGSAMPSGPRRQAAVLPNTRGDDEEGHVVHEQAW